MAEINIPIKAEIQELLDKLNLVKKDIDNISTSAKEAGATISKGFSGNNITSTNKELKRTNGLIEDIEEAIKEWDIAKKKATDIKEIEKYNRKIAEGKKELEEYNKKGLPAMKNINAEATKGQSIFAGLGAKIAAAFSVYAVINFAKEALNAYNMQLKNEMKLKAALGERGAMFETLKKQSEELQEKTAIDDDTILSAQSFLAVQGRTEKQIKKMTKTALDLSVVLGTDVLTATKYLDQTFEGTIGRLGKYDERLKTLTDSQLENGDAVDLLAGKYEGMAEKSATSLDKLQIKWEEFKKRAGNFIYKTLFETNEDITKDSITAGSDIAENFINSYSEKFKSKGGNLKEEAKKYIDGAFKEYEKAVSEVDKFTESMKTLTPSERLVANVELERLSKNLGIAKKTYQSLYDIINAKETKATTIDYASLSVERLTDLLESATKSEAKLIKAEIKRKEEAKINAEIYNKSVIDAEYTLLQQRIDLQDEGVKKQQMIEDLRYKKELATLNTNIKNKIQLFEALENAKKIHENNLIKISEKSLEEKYKQAYELEKALIEYQFAGTEEEIKEQQKELLKIELQYIRDLYTAKIISQEEYEVKFLNLTKGAKEKDLKALEEEYRQAYELEKALIEYQFAGTEEEIKEQKKELLKIELQYIRDKYEAGIITEQEYKVLFLKLTKSTADLELKYISDLYEAKIISKEQYDVLFLKLTKSKAEKEKDIEKKNSKEIKELKLEFLQETFEASFKMLENFSERQLNKEQSDLEKKYSREEELLNKRLESGKITQEKYDAELKRMKEAKDKADFELEMKKYKRNKAVSISEIIINTAVQASKIEGIGAVLASNPLTALFSTMAGVQLALLLASSAMQTAVVMSAPPPTFAEGGKLGGRPHSQGGTLVEAEKDEWFINKISSKKYDSVLNNINKDNSFEALRELAKLNGISIDHNMTNDIKEKERLASAMNVSINEIKEIKEIRDILKSQSKEIIQGKGYYIEKIGNIKRKIYEA